MIVPRNGSMPVRNPPRSEGWAIPRRAARWHFIRDGVSLCGMWSFKGHLYESLAPRAKDCHRCQYQLSREALKS